MLRITIDLIPFGQEEHLRQLSQFEIVNTGKRIRGLNEESGRDYAEYVVRKSADNPVEIARFTHDRDDGVLMCVLAALDKLTDKGVDKL